MPDSLAADIIRAALAADNITFVLNKPNTSSYPELKDFVGYALSVITVLLSIGLSVYSSASAVRKNNSLPILTSFMDEWRRPEGIREAFQKVNNYFTEEKIRALGVIPFSDLPDEIQPCARRLSYYLDNIGLITWDKLIKPDAVVAFIGSNAYIAWKLLETYIEEERIKKVNAHTERVKERNRLTEAAFQNGELNEYSPEEVGDFDGDRFWQFHFEYFAHLHIRGLKALNERLEEDSFTVYKCFRDSRWKYSPKYIPQHRTHKKRIT